MFLSTYKNNKQNKSASTQEKIKTQQRPNPGSIWTDAWTHPLRRNWLGLIRNVARRNRKRASKIRQLLDFTIHNQEIIIVRPRRSPFPRKVSSSQVAIFEHFKSLQAWKKKVSSLYVCQILQKKKNSPDMSRQTFTTSMQYSSVSVYWEEFVSDWVGARVSLFSGLGSISTGLSKASFLQESGLF